MAQTMMGGVIEFFQRLGVYDVILPFLLVFTIVFAILEKTKVFGVEKVGKEVIPRKNLNAMASFVIAFLVVASSKLVETITQVSSQMVILLLLVVFFLLLVGTFFGKEELEKEGVKLEKGWRILFMVFMLIGIIFIFLDALKLKTGETWLGWFVRWISESYTSTSVASIILMIIVIGVIIWIVRKPKEGTKPAGGS